MIRFLILTLTAFALPAFAATTVPERHGRCLDCNHPHLKQDQTLSNIFVTMLQKVEVNAEVFVDSSGLVSEIIG